MLHDRPGDGRRVPTRDTLEGKAPRRRPQRRLGRQLEEVAKAVGGGYCQLQMPLSLALGVRGTVAGHRLGALEKGGGGTSPLRMHPWSRRAWRAVLTMAPQEHFCSCAADVLVYIDKKQPAKTRPQLLSDLRPEALELKAPERPYHQPPGGWGMGWGVSEQAGLRAEPAHRPRTPLTEQRRERDPPKQHYNVPT